MNIQGIPGSIDEKRETLERITSKLEVLNPHQAFVLLKNAFAIPKLQYLPRASPAYLCGEMLSVFDRALFDTLGRVANVSLEGDRVRSFWSWSLRSGTLRSRSFGSEPKFGHFGRGHYGPGHFGRGHFCLYFRH